MVKTTAVLDKIFIGLLLAVFGGIVLHAPLSVYFGTQFADASLFIKSWKEIVMGVALVLLLAIVTIRKRWAMFHSPVFYVVGVYALLHLLAIPIFYNGAEATAAGLFIDLRYLLFLVLAYAAVVLYPQARRWFLVTFIAGAAVVLGFALLQLTVLPHDFLKYLGYGETTIMPFLTVDQNIDYIRINSTLRGPNPLGAYAIISLVLAAAIWFRGPKKLKKYELWGILALAALSVVALWASYSRSAALGAALAFGILVLAVYGRRIGKVWWISFFAVMLVLGGSLVALRDTTFVSQVILHEDPNEGGDVNSNDGHAQSLLDGAQRMADQPFGAGVGSTGSASLLTNKPLIIENQYLFIAHETGWLGFGLFVALSIMVLRYAWGRRRDWLSLAVVASGAGLMLVGLLLPVWVDDTVSIVWWGLAGVVLAGIPTLRKGVFERAKARTKAHAQRVHAVVKKATAGKRGA